MGIVKISDLLHDDIRDASKAMSRSVNAQAEYWIRLGMMSELYPELNHQPRYPEIVRASEIRVYCQCRHHARKSGHDCRLQ